MSARRTGGNGCSSWRQWPTATGFDATAGATAKNVRLLGREARQWPTMTVNGNYNRVGSSPTSGDGLATMARQWSTATSREWKDGASRNFDVPTNGILGREAVRVDVAPLCGPRETPPLRSVPWPPGPDDVDGWRAYLAVYPEAAPVGVPRGKPNRHGNDGRMLNAYFVEALMGFPISWTALLPRIDRLRCLGNAVVPECAALAITTLAGELTAKLVLEESS